MRSALLPRWSWMRFVLAAGLVGLSSALRVWPLGSLGSILVWLTYYPTLMVAALLGGLAAGMAATALSCVVVVFFWDLLVRSPFISSTADWIGLGVFCFNGTLMSAVAEAMRRAQERARKAKEQAEAANRAKSTFLASMSHELRTPLNAILGFSSLLRRDDGLSEDQRRSLGLIHRSGEHLLALIDGVLDMAKVEGGRVSVERTIFNLTGTLREVVDLLEVRARERGLALTLELAPDIPALVAGDAGKLRQCLTNLVSNAVKYTEHGRVAVRCGAHTQTRDPACVWLSIVVEDTGIGIAEADLDRVFQPFTQLAPTHLKRGTGLGLSITKRFVELLEGRIRVESVVGQGSRFSLELPLAKVDERTIQTFTRPSVRVIGIAASAAGHFGAGSEIRVLVVEDQPENSLLLERTLAGVGFTVRVAENGRLGVEAFTAWRPHFVWMDVRMPVMDGLEATRRIRALPGGGSVKIAALTASVFAEEKERVLAAGADDFIRKPFREAELFDCMARHLGLEYVREATPSSRALPAVDAARAPATAGADAGPGAAPGCLEPTVLAALPAELSAPLKEALLALDCDRLSAAIARIGERDAALGDALSFHAESLAFSAILRSLSARQPAAPTGAPP